MDHDETKTALAALWPEVDSNALWATLAEAAKTNPSIDAALRRAGSLPRTEAATLLMAPVAATLGSIRKRTLSASDAIKAERTLDAVNALVLRGGDPSEVLGTVADGLTNSRTSFGAARVFSNAVLAGCSLDTVRDRLMTEVDATTAEHWTGLARARRLAELQRLGKDKAISQLVLVYRRLPLGDLFSSIGMFKARLRRPNSANLFGAVGLLEARLLEAEPEEAKEAEAILEKLSEGTRDALASWMILLPIMRDHLSSRESLALEACRALAQLPRTIAVAPHSAVEAADRLPGKLGSTLTALVPLLLRSDGLAAMAAEALMILVQHGGALSDLEAQVEAAIDHRSLNVRRFSSRALSIWRIRSGMEKPTPRGTSRRRVLGESAEPLNSNQAPKQCNACGARATLLFTHMTSLHQFAGVHEAEALCSECGLYSQYSHRWEG